MVIEIDDIRWVNSIAQRILVNMNHGDKLEFEDGDCDDIPDIALALAGDAMDA
ncbi:MAG: hypothetical protein ACLGJC_18395 [Alphaproteobacteria bacterium]